MEDYKKEADKFKITGLKVLTPYDVYSLLVGALEGGSNYWYLIDTDVHKYTPEMEGEPYVDRMLMAIQKGHPVKVLDVETEEDLGTLTSESWAKAETLMLEKHRRHFADVIGENDDASTADVFFQLAVIGELTYG